MRFYKKWLDFLVLVLMTILLLTAPAFAVSNEFAVGSGTEDDPYLILSKTDLDNVRNYPNACFRMVGDINFTADDFAEDGQFYHNGAGWVPITYFSGTFDGGGYTISGLTSVLTETGRMGLFSRNEGTILSLRLADIDWDATESPADTKLGLILIGGIAAENGGLIEGCAVDGNIRISAHVSDVMDSYLGGIAGKNSGTIQCCANMSLVESQYSAFSDANRTGGITGANNGLISRCHNTGCVEGGKYSGGIAAINTQTVEDCFNIGTVSAKKHYKEDIIISGGICGTSSGIVRTCYNAGRVAGAIQDPCVSINTGSTSNCYYYDWAVNRKDHPAGLSTLEMQQPQSFSGFDFNTVWTFAPDSNYPFPVLQNMTSINVPVYDATDFSGGSGLPWDPYQISMKEQFSSIRWYPKACYLLTDDIDLTEGDYGQEYDFQGFFDGGGYTIRLLEPSYVNYDESTIASNNWRKSALFYSNCGVLTNIRIISGISVTVPVNQGTITQRQKPTHISGIVSQNKDTGVIRNCQVLGRFSVKNEAVFGRIDVSGIADTNYGRIEDCANQSRIIIDAISACAGGIFSTGSSGVVTRCQNTGDIVISTDRNGTSISITAGGIAAYNLSTVITECTNSGNISTEAKIHKVTGYGYSGIRLQAWSGGIVGDWLLSGEISDCTNSGNISAATDEGTLSADMAASYCGGICGSAGYYVEKRTTYQLTQKGTCNITRCSNSGDITADNTAGRSWWLFSSGIAGACSGVVTDCWNSGSARYAITTNPQMISHCYNTGRTDKGLVSPFIDTSGKCYADNCYDAGTTTSKYTTNNESVIHAGAHCYFLKGTPTQKYTNACTELDMRKQSTYEALGFDFENVWVMLPGLYNYPQLRSNLATPINSIYIAELPTEPIICIEGHFKSYQGLKLGVVFENGETAIVEPWEECFALLNMDVQGTQRIPLKVLDCTTAETVEVTVRDKDIAFISVKTPPVQCRYFKDAQTIDLTGAMIEVHYDNDTVESISVTEDMVSGFIPGKIGTQSLSILYNGHVCSFDITVYDIARIEPEVMPTKVDYVQGQPFNADGGILDIIYTDSMVEQISLSDAVISYDRAATGTVIITASYGGKETTFNVTMRARKAVTLALLKEPDKLSYAPFEELDFTGSQLKVVFESEDSYTEYLTLSNEMISGYHSAEPGYQKLTVQYCGKTTDFAVWVRNPISKKCSFSISEEGLLHISAGLDLAEQTQGIAILGAYRDGQSVSVCLTRFIKSGDNSILEFVLPEALETDSFVLFLLDDAYCPIFARQALTLVKAG